MKLFVVAMTVAGCVVEAEIANFETFWRPSALATEP
jgi:hypothetical protein